MGASWMARKLLGTFTPSLELRAMGDSLSVSRTTPMGSLTNIAVVNKADNAWATAEGKTIAAAFSHASTIPGGPALFVIVVSHKVGDIMTVYGLIPDGSPGISVITTVHKRPGDAAAAPSTAPPDGEVIMRLSQVFVAASS